MAEVNSAQVARALEHLTEAQKGIVGEVESARADIQRLACRLEETFVKFTAEWGAPSKVCSERTEEDCTRQGTTRQNYFTVTTSESIYSVGSPLAQRIEDTLIQQSNSVKQLELPARSPSRRRERVPTITHFSSSPPQIASTETDRNMPDAYARPSSPSADPPISHALPRLWPADLEMREQLRHLVHKDDDTTRGPAISRSRRSASQGFDDPNEHLLEQDTPAGAKRRFVIKPNSRFRSTLSFISFLVLLYDLTLIPLVLAWDIQYEGTMLVLAWIVVGFWSFDVIMNFFSGYYDKGAPILRHVDIIRHYLRTWFAIDFTVVVCDYVSLLLTDVADGGGSSSLRIVRFAKLSRLLKIFGMLRVLKFVRKFEDYVEGNLSESVRLMLHFVRIFCVILWCNHLLACCWWFLGSSREASDTDYSWAYALIPVREDNQRYVDLSMGFQYTTAFHWSVAQITLGAVEIVCGNTLERLYNVVCLLLGLLLGTTLISSISATMVDYQMNRKEHTDKMRTLRRYLHENSVAPRLALRVQQQVVERFRERQRMQQGSVKALDVLAPSLHHELRFEINRPHLIRHGLFRLWINFDQPSVQTHFMDVVEVHSIPAKDELFIFGGQAVASYLLLSGKLCYIQEPEFAPVSSQQRTEITADEQLWLAEAALWSLWIHVGHMEAGTLCDIVSIKADELCQALKKRGIIQDITLQYCQNFHKRLLASKPPTADWPNDLCVPFTDFGDIVLSMTPVVQAAIGLDAVHHIVHNKVWKGGKTSTGLEKLKVEIQKGTSIVVVDGKGEARRVVAVVALRLEDGEGNIFVQVGKLDNGVRKAACQLPGGKQERAEMAVDAMTRIMAAKVGPFVGRIQVEKVERMVEENESKEFGVRTKYLRTVFTCPVVPGANVNLDIIPQLRDGDGSCVKSAPASASLKRFEASGINAEKLVALEESLVAKRSVFKVVETGKSTENLYAWVTDMEFKLLKDNEAIITRWLEGLDLRSENAAADMVPLGEVDIRPPLSPAASRQAEAEGLEEPHDSLQPEGTSQGEPEVRWEFDPDTFTDHTGPASRGSDSARRSPVSDREGVIAEP